jgi:hypothetical protein
MAELQQVQVNEVNEEANISLEQQAAMQEEAANKRNQTLEADPMAKAQEEATEEVKEEATERPEWLDEKFESPEDMAKAYSELQKKLSEPKEEEKEESAEKVEASKDTPAPMASAIETAQSDFATNGELSEDSYKALEEAGLPREFVDSYVAGQEARSASQASEIQGTIGGEENYKAMSEWASENLADGELDAYNSMVESGSVEQARVAVKGLYAQFQASGGAAPALVQGSTSGESGVQPFGSAAQVTAAMRDARYATDPAYRAQVEQRMSVSSIF